MRNATMSRLPRQRRPQRFARLSADPDTLSVFLHLRQVQPSGRESIDTYLFTEIATDTDAARAFSLTKSDGTVYHAEVAALMEKGRLDAPVCHDVAA